MSHSSAPLTAESESSPPNPPAPEAAFHADGAETATTCRQCRRPTGKKRAGFQPSERQLQLAEILATDKDALTVISLCEKAGVTRNTFYRWQRDTQFQLWLARIAMQTLLATSPMLLMQGVNDALNGDFRAWRTMLNFAYNPRGLAALDAFLARLEENAASSDPADPAADPPADIDAPPRALGDDSGETAAADTTPRTTPLPAAIGSTIATTARVVRDLRRSAAKSHTPAPSKPKFEVSYKYTPPAPKPSATVAESPAAEPQSTLPTATAPMSVATVPAAASPNSTSGPAASPGPQPDALFPDSPAAPLIERARKFTPTDFINAAFNGEFGMVKIALSVGADVNARDDKYGATALSVAAAAGHIEIIRLLLRRGADINARDNQGRTALDHARRQNQRAAVELLLEAGAR